MLSSSKSVSRQIRHHAPMLIPSLSISRTRHKVKNKSKYRLAAERNLGERLPVQLTGYTL